MRKGWQTVKLVDACEVYQPKTISKKEMLPDGEFVVFGANGIIGRYDKYNHEESQVLVTCRGATCGSINVSEPHAWITGNAMVIRPITDGFSKLYLEYYLRGAVDFSAVITGAAQPQITRQSLAKVKFSYPPLSEQERIVSILDKAFEGIDKAIAQTEQNLASARELFESYLNNIFTQKGEDWVEKKLGEVCSKIGSGATPKGGADSYKTEGISLIRSLNVYGWRFTDKKLAYIDDKQASKLNNVVVEKADVLFNITGASIARCCVAPEEYLPARVNQHVSILRPDQTELLPWFLCYILTSRPYKKLLLGIGDEGGSTRQAITKKQLQDLVVTFPDLTTQSGIIDWIQKAYEKFQQLEALYTEKLESLKELKQSLLQQAFAGELTKEDAA